MRLHFIFFYQIAQLKAFLVRSYVYQCIAFKLDTGKTIKQPLFLSLSYLTDLLLLLLLLFFRFPPVDLFKLGMWMQDVAYLHGFLRTIEGLNVPGLTLAHRDAELRDLCRIGVHRRVPEDVLLYRAGDLCDCWYILLTGSVLIETSMFLPRAW